MLVNIKFSKLNILINHIITMRAPLLNMIFFLLLITIKINANEVDIFNILLPTAYHATGGHVKQLITTSGGCYNW